MSSTSPPTSRTGPHLSDFGPANATGGQWECPDLFPLAVDGDPNNIKWVMVVNINPGGVAGGSAGQYFVGNFDGTTFTSETTEPVAPSPPERPGRIQRRHLQRLDRQQRTRQLEERPFGDAPAAGALPGQSPVTGFAGDGLINSFNDGDWPLGSMQSPTFTVTDDYLNFLVGGGKHPHVSDKLDNTPPAGRAQVRRLRGSRTAQRWPTPAGPAPATSPPTSSPSTSGGDFYIGAKRINTFETGTTPAMTGRAP